MKINIQTIINELRENTTEEQKKRLSILENTIGRLVEQLEEANEVVKYYAYEDNEQWIYDEEKNEERIYTYPVANDTTMADDYLEKWSVK